jgi:DNA-binding NtrC family response regulator
MKMPPRSISPTAMQKLISYNFPGNIRELRNLVERALILSEGAVMGPDDFPLSPSAHNEAPSQSGWIAALPESIHLRETLEEVEKALIARALESGGGVQAEAARRLNLSRSDLAYKLTKHGI